MNYPHNPVTWILIFVCFNFLTVQGDLLERLHHYEVLHQDDFSHHIVKRNVHNVPVTSERTVTVKTLGKEFKLRLHRQRSLLSDNFHAEAVSQDNLPQRVPLSEDEFYKGEVEGDKGSKVSAYWEDGNLVATIRAADDIYSIEPSWRHVVGGDKRTMISYRASDVKKLTDMNPESQMGASYCGFVHPDDSDEAAFIPPKKQFFQKYQDKNQKFRGKRQASTKNTCTLALVADYRFYRDVGGSDAQATAKYIIAAISRVDDVYRGTDFDGAGNYANVGFEIQQVTIHTSPTTDQGEHYNMEQTTWDTKALLKAFSKNPAWAEVCLAHLFTSTSFSDGVLGLGWIASSAENSAGGICSPASGEYYYKTAWTSAINKYGDRLLTQETDLVTAHEFGHNFGSQHDPDTDECDPGQLDGGSYLMYTYSVSGYDTNNKLMSPCTQRAILAVLESKASTCFTEPSRSFCGNFQVEEDEECDTGPPGGNDTCCDDNCKLRTGAVCSDKNTACCQNCQLASASKVCSGTAALATSCVADTFCDGASTSCPPENSKPDGTECIDNGKCLAGECLAFCESKGLHSCKCNAVEVSCKTCCRSNSTTGACEPYVLSDGATTDLSDGKTCVQGTCEAGECIKEIRELSDRLWNILENFDVNYLVQFMKNNIVITTLVISLIIYIPLCLVVYCIDKKIEKEDDDEIAWKSKENAELLHSSDNRLIMQSYSKRRPKTSTPKMSEPRRGYSNMSTASSSKVKVHPI